MKILAIDSSTAPASVAVMENGIILGEFTININRTHSEKLLLLVDGLLDVLSMSVKDIDAFAISVGPGSFTGLRIGMSAAKLMAQTTGKPLIGVKTLEALAENVVAFDGIICPVLDARNNTVYRAIYDCSNGILTEIKSADAVDVNECADELKHLNKSVLVCGEYEKYKSILQREFNDHAKISLAPRHLTYQRSSSVAAVANRLYEGGVRTLPEDVVPFYVRESQAEQAKRAKDALKNE